MIPLEVVYMYDLGIRVNPNIGYDASGDLFMGDILLVFMEWLKSPNTILLQMRRLKPSKDTHLCFRKAGEDILSHLCCEWQTSLLKEFLQWTVKCFR